MADFTERQMKIIKFALWRFVNDAHAQANAAAQDKHGRYFRPGALGSFLKDAEDGEELLALLQQECRKDLFSSRACERGTNGCVVEHGPLQHGAVEGGEQFIRGEAYRRNGFACGRCGCKDLIYEGDPLQQQYREGADRG